MATREINIVQIVTKIALDCPYCGVPIYETLEWFKKAYSTCPDCDKGLSADQFATVINDLEQAMNENIEEMVHGQPHGGCCGKKCSCS
jgi:hypothetical protein